MDLIEIGDFVGINSPQPDKIGSIRWFGEGQLPGNLVINGSIQLTQEGITDGGEVVEIYNEFLIVKFPTTSGYTQLGFLSTDLMVKRKKQPKKLKTEALNKLIIDQSVKDEIRAVLKQHQHSKKIFEDWGLKDTIQYGKGMTFLFYGSPGTGKTWAAHLIAESMGQELLIIGAGDIQSSEPGAPNRNITQAFRKASKEGKVLFIDECDSLVSSRDGLGMILGSEINTLLTEIEKFEGVAVLATNRITTLDEALERRISLIVEFPEPDYEQRQDIWKTLLPDKLPRSKDATIQELSRYRLTGGLIKNCILQAARFAAAEESDKVTLKHFKSAISRVLKSKSLLGTASRYSAHRVRENVGADVGRGAVDVDKIESLDKTRTLVEDKDRKGK